MHWSKATRYYKHRVPKLQGLVLGSDLLLEVFWSRKQRTKDSNGSGWQWHQRRQQSKQLVAGVAVSKVSIHVQQPCRSFGSKVHEHMYKCMHVQSSVPFCSFFFHKQGIYRYHYTMLLSFGSEAAQFLFWNVTLQIVIFDKRGWAKAWSDCFCLHGAQVGMPCSKHFNQFLPSSCIPHCRNVQKRNGIIFGVLNSWSYLMFEHQGPKIGPRINLTWRWIVQHSATPWISSVHHGHGSGGTCMPNFQHTVVIAASVFYS